MSSDNRFINKAQWMKRLARVPVDIKQAGADQLKIEVDDLVAAMQRAAPVGGADDPTPGKFRDSIHGYPNPDRPYSYRILADAKDERGHFVGAHIEFGHKTEGGEHVEPRPSFFPTYRARKSGMKRRMSAAIRKVLKKYNSEV